MASSNYGPFGIAVNESNASRRMVYFSLFSASRETMPMTLGQLSVQPALHIGGRAAVSTTSTVRAADATNGLYYLVLTQSETTVVGHAMLRMSNTSTRETTVHIQFTAVDSGDSMRFGLFSQPNAGANASGGLPVIGSDYGSTFTVGVSNVKANTYSGVTFDGLNRINSSVTIANATYSQVTVRHEAGDFGSITTFGVSKIAAASYSGVTMQGLSNYANISSVTLNVGTHSGATVQGLSNYANISNVTLAAGTHSNVTIQGLSNYANISNVTLAAGTHSGATIQGLTRINSSVTIANATYSAVTVRLDLQDYSGATVGVNNIKPAAYSGVSVEVTPGGIQSVSFGASSIDAVALATSAGQEIGDRVLLRALATGSDAGRSVQDALRANRNRVQIGSSIVTVYQEDDTTSAWTAAITTGTAVSITDLDPSGP